MAETKLAYFLNGIDKIVFDMDGVITSEQNYWNTVSLTVYEMLNSEKYFGTEKIDVERMEKNLEQIRKEVLYDDKLIVLLKEKGVNSNWDLAYVVLSFALLENKKTIKNVNHKENVLNTLYENLKHEYNAEIFKQIYIKLSSIEAEGFALYDLIGEKFNEVCQIDKKFFTRDGDLWGKCHNVFQEWYLGEEIFKLEYNKNPLTGGKKGLMQNEKPLIPIGDLENVLEILYKNNIKLGIGTGRVYTEIHTPLKLWGLEKYFDSNMYITYTDIIKGEKKNVHLLKGKHLTKPHPFMFLKAIYGKDYSEEKLLKGEYDKGLIDRTLIVGDAGSDIMAAQAIGCKFAAVLTGVSGKKAENYFKEMNSDYILDSICDFIL